MSRFPFALFQFIKSVDKLGRRQHLEKALHQLHLSTPILSNNSDIKIFKYLSRGARSASASSSSRTTYDLGVRRFLSYLDLTKQSLAHFIETQSLAEQMLPYSAYLFVIEHLAYRSIRAYIAALQFSYFQTTLSKLLFGALFSISPSRLLLYKSPVKSLYLSVTNYQWLCQWFFGLTIISLKWQSLILDHLSSLFIST